MGSPENDSAQLQRTVRRHKREDELTARRNKRAEPVLKKLNGNGHNVLAKGEFVALVEYLFIGDDAAAGRALRKGEFSMGGMTVEAR